MYIQASYCLSQAPKHQTPAAPYQVTGSLTTPTSRSRGVYSISEIEVASFRSGTFVNKDAVGRIISRLPYYHFLSRKGPRETYRTHWSVRPWPDAQRCIGGHQSRIRAGPPWATCAAC